VLGQKIRTPDIMAEGCTVTGTSGMGDAVVATLSQQKADAA